MTYTKIYQNSYVIFIITFLFLSIVFYLFRIGYQTSIENGKFVKKFSWKYPLAISLIVWLFWHFCLYPPSEEASTNIVLPQKENFSSSINKYLNRSNISSQKINMVNWY